MAEEVGGIEYEVDLNLRGMTAGGRRLDRALSGVEKRTKKTDLAFFKLGKVAAAIFTGVALNRIKAYSDSFTNLQNQLRQVTKDAENLAGATEAVFRVANETRSSVEATAGLYSKLARSTQELGLSQKDVLDLTETINKSFAVSGATAQEASNAITQLAQGLASGALRGDEFNSVAEQAPGILRAVAQETGLSIGQLREFAAEGKITTELLVRALKNYSATADAEFGKAKVTIEQSITVLDNNFTRFVGVLNDATGASGLASNAIISLSNTVIMLANLVGSGALSDVFSTQIGFIAEDMAATTKIIENEFADMINFVGEHSPMITTFLSDAFMNFVPNVRAAIKLATVEIAAFIDRTAAYATAIARTLNPFDDFDRFDARAELRKQNEAIDKTRQSVIDGILKENAADKDVTIKSIERSKERIEQYKREQQERFEALEQIQNIDFGMSGDQGKSPVTNAITAVQAFKDELGGLREEAKNVDAAMGEAFGQTVVAGVDGLSNSIGDAIVNQESLGDAVKDTARSMATDLLKSMIKIGLQNMINGAIARSQIQQTETTQVASNATIAGSAATAAGLQSVASYGGAAVAGLGALVATMAIAKSFGGNRFNGGAVTGGSMYRVGEMNKPEILQSGDKQYLIPGESGKVISNKEMTSNSGGSTVNLDVIINNNTTARVSTEMSREGDRQQLYITMDDVVSNIRGRGSVHNAITTTTTAQNRAGR